MSTRTLSPDHRLDMRARHRRGFLAVGVSFLVAMAFSTVPTPLYPIYQQRDGFSTFTVTLVFSVYAVGVVAALILLGHLSDVWGRRRLLLAGLGLELVAAVMFLCSTDLAMLYPARLVAGFGIGLITATATAYLHELHTLARPGTGPGRAEMLATTANIGGLGVGPLVAGFLAQFVPWPLHTPYLVFGVLLVLSLAAVLVTPETVTRPAARPRWHPQRVRAHGDPARFVLSSLSGFVAFAIFGMFTSLAAGFLAGSLHHTSRLLAGVAVFGVFGAAAAVQLISGRFSEPARFGSGVAGVAAGLVILAVGMQTGSLAGFLIGGVIAGGGSGMLFKYAVGVVIAGNPPAVRGEALAALFLAGYLGLIVPVIGIGVAVLSVAETSAMFGFSAVLLVLLAITVRLRMRSAR